MRRNLLPRIQPIILCEVVEVVTCLARRAKSLSRNTFGINHVVSREFDVKILDDSRPFGRTLRNASSVDEILRGYKYPIM